MSMKVDWALQTCVCGHVQDEHDQEGLFSPCAIEGCECGDYEEEEPLPASGIETAADLEAEEAQRAAEDRALELREADRAEL